LEPSSSASFVPYASAKPVASGPFCFDVESARRAVVRNARAGRVRDRHARTLGGHVARGPETLSLGARDDVAGDARARGGRCVGRRLVEGAGRRRNGRVPNETGRVVLGRSERGQVDRACDRFAQRRIVEHVRGGDARSARDDRAHADRRIAVRDVLMDRVVREPRQSRIDVEDDDLGGRFGGGAAREAEDAFRQRLAFDVIAS
jgi:hypothetical protein